MSLTDILLGIIILLTGILIGGAGGQALVQRVMKSNGMVNYDTATASISAVTSATSTAAASVLSISDHIADLQTILNKHTDSLNEINVKQVQISSAFEGFCKVCELKHATIEQDRIRMQAELDNAKR